MTSPRIALLVIAGLALTIFALPRLQARARWVRLQDLKSGRRPRPAAIAWLIW